MKKTIKRMVLGGGFRNRKELEAFLWLKPGELEEYWGNEPLRAHWLNFLRHERGVSPGWVESGQGEPLVRGGWYDSRGCNRCPKERVSDCPALALLWKALREAETCRHLCGSCREKPLAQPGSLRQ